VRIASPTRLSVLDPGLFSSLFLIALGLGALSTSLIAAPRDEITQAVIAGGAGDTADASHAVFMRAFTAVAVGIKSRDLPNYAAAAIQLRPDLAARIVVDSIRIMSRTDQRVTCAAVARLVSVTIAANPDSALRIAAAAIKARPDLRSCIIAAASETAPEQRSQFAKLETYFSLALLSIVINDSDVEPWHGSGTLNPANVLDLRVTNAVISPEQPPSSR